MELEFYDGGTFDPQYFGPLGAQVGPDYSVTAATTLLSARFSCPRPQAANAQAMTQAWRVVVQVQPAGTTAPTDAIDAASLDIDLHAAPIDAPVPATPRALAVGDVVRCGLVPVGTPVPLDAPEFLVDLADVVSTTPPDPTTPPPPPTDPPSPRLYEAIYRRTMATPGLAGALVGGLHEGIADPKTPMPYATLLLIATLPAYNTGAGRTESLVYQASFAAPLAKQAEQIADTWKATFSPQALAAAPLLIDGGYVQSAYTRATYHAPDDSQAPGGARRHKEVVETVFLVGRN